MTVIDATLLHVREHGDYYAKIKFKLIPTGGAGEFVSAKRKGLLRRYREAAVPVDIKQYIPPGSRFDIDVHGVSMPLPTQPLAHLNRFDRVLVDVTWRVT